MLIWGNCTKCNMPIPFSEHRWKAEQPHHANLCSQCQRKSQQHPITDSIGGLMFLAFLLVIALKVAFKIIVP